MEHCAHVVGAEGENSGVAALDPYVAQALVSFGIFIYQLLISFDLC